MHITAGIPQVPDTPIGVTNDHGGVVLTLHTAVSGRVRSQMFSFIVNFTQTSASMKGSRVLFASDYVDGERHQFTINGLMEGVICSVHRHEIGLVLRSFLEFLLLLQLLQVNPIRGCVCVFVFLYVALFMA